jgi:RNA polymerase sigma factor (sigma-70 family)
MPTVGESAGLSPDVAETRFERCFAEHYADVLAFALRRLPGRAGAEDAVAETFAIAWRRREVLPEQALPWLYAIAFRVIANQRRSARRRRELEGRLAHEAGAGRADEDPATAIDRRDAFAVAFARLTEREREVLRLVAWDGLGTEEAAQVLGCSPGAFRVRLHRARRRLAKQLRRAGHSPDESAAVAPKPDEEAS